MASRYIFYVPPNASLQFKDVFSLAPLHNTFIEQRVYTPKQPITNVKRTDYVTLCIDMEQEGRMGDFDGEYNSFLTQCAGFGDKLSVLMKGAPNNMNSQRWKVQKGKLLTQLDDDGRLLTWESISDQVSGTDQYNRLQRFMKIIRRENKSQNNMKLPVLLVVVILLLIVSWKIQDIRLDSELYISHKDSTISELKRQQDAILQLVATNNYLKDCHKNCADAIPYWQQEADNPEFKFAKHLSDEENGARGRRKAECEDNVDSAKEKQKEIEKELENIREWLKAGVNEQAAYVVKNSTYLKDIQRNQYCKVLK